MVISRIIDKVERFFILRCNSDRKIRYYRKQGMDIGNKCHLGGRLCYTNEAYLIQIGDHVDIADGTLFVTHDAGMWVFSEDFPEDDVFGKITIGNNVMIGMKCIILPNSVIGNDCIIGAGSVVRGKFPANSVIMGNPAKVVTKTSMLKLLYKKNPGRLSTAKLSDKQKEPIVRRHFGV